MISIISDIHLSDGTTSFNVHKEAFLNVFKNNILNEVKDNEAKELKIILLGDIIDFVRTDYWLRILKDERPWNAPKHKLDPTSAMNPDSGLMLKHYSAVLNSIFAHESTIGFFQALNEIKDTIGGSIPVEIHYVVGNHDRILNCLPSLQDAIKSKLSSYASNEVIFRNEFRDTSDYSILCRHGHEFDENNYGREVYAYLNGEDADEINRFKAELYKVQSIGEVITAELMSGLIYRLNKLKANSEFINAVKDINNIRPMTDAFIWLYWYGKEQTKKNKGLLMKAFRESLQAVIDSSLGVAWDNIIKEFWYFRGDITDRFEQLLGLVEDKRFDDVASLVETIKPVFSFFSGKGLDDYAKGAKSAFASGAAPDIQYVVMGHTHEALTLYFKGDIDDRVNMYINTGTYLPFIERVRESPVVSFVNANQLTLLNIYRRDEDLNNGKKNKYPTMDLWNGIKRKSYNK